MTVQTPTIIIGLGGIGSEIVERIERMTRMKAQLSKKYVRDNIEFVIMDTDEKSISQRRKQGYGGYWVSLSGNITVGKCLEWDEDAQKNWYPDSEIFNLKSLSEGAGQVRAISRLAFQRAIRAGRLHSLHEAIENLHLQTESSTNQNLKIILVSTLAGGTGSGCILPLALYLKNYIKNKYSSSEAKINACLLLPDILESEKISHTEKENLYANGYSAIKELSYFMHKSDNEIWGDGIFINLPEDESNKLVRHERLPFDFCYLFGKYTSKIRSMGTLEAYKKVIARCLYTQLIGSFSSIYFSREDNMTVTSIKRVSTFGEQEEITQSHYASANCFEVSYPYQEIKEYLTLRWAREMMDEGWMKFDKEASRLEVQQRKAGKQDTSLKSNIDYFLAAIESLVGSEDEEAQELGKTKNYAGQYLNCLFNYIKSRAEEKMIYWRQVKDAVQCMRKNKKDWTEENISALMEFHVAIDRSVMAIEADIESAIMYEICQIHDKSSKLKPYYIEYYFYDSEKKEYKTPNAIRYFIGRLVKEITDIQYGKRKAAENARKAMNNVRKELSSVETLDKVNDYEGTWYWGKQDIRNDILEKYDALLDKSFEVLTEEIGVSCLEKIKSYIGMIFDTYERFFYEYKDTSAYCEQKIDGLEKILFNSVQGADMLVCANKECLEGMFEKMQSEPVYYRTGGEISEWIYEYCYKKKEDRNRICNFLQDDEILSKWMHMFENKFSSFFNINVFQAFTEEARYKKDNIEKNKYIMQALERAEKDYSAPLLTLCRMDEPEGKAYCIYSPKLENNMEYYEVVKRYFETAESVCDEYDMDVDDKKIIFYQNRYGLEAYNIDFFAYDQGVKNSFSQGFGYKAYLNVLERITGETEKAKLTPHIDKTWHKRERMPDIGKEKETEYFHRAVQALLIGVIEKKISYADKKMSYKKKTECSIGDMIDYFMVCVVEAQRIVEDARKVIKGMIQFFDEAIIKNQIINMIKDYYDELQSNQKADEKIVDVKVAEVLQAISEIYFWIGKGNAVGTDNPFKIMKEEWKNLMNGEEKGKKVGERLQFLREQWEVK